MNNTRKGITRALIGPAIIFALLLATGDATAHGEKTDLSKAIFYVRWYSVGKAALEGLRGVKKAENGFHNGRETNTVYYDPAMITIEEMKEALERARTYTGIAR